MDCKGDADTTLDQEIGQFAHRMLRLGDCESIARNDHHATSIDQLSGQVGGRDFEHRQCLA